jgi:hypothetical protein
MSLDALDKFELNEAAALAAQKNPYIFFEHALGVTTFEDYQKKVIDAFWVNDRICVSACHDVGKTFLAARLAMAFLATHPNSKVITTAPTFNQVERILWSEIRAAHGKAKWPLGGKLNMTDWTFNPEWFALGFSPRNEAGGETEGQVGSSFQGFHAANLLIIFDEATGIPHNIWTMAEGLMTSAHVKFLAIGNPTSTDSEFYKCFRSREWTKIYLSCFDSPNLIANGVTTKADLQREVEHYKSLPDAAAREYLNQYKVTRPYLLTTKWVVTQAAKWGIEHPLTVSKILGKFPVAGDKTLVPLGFIEDAALRVAYPSESDRKCIGVDVARYGADATILTALNGRKQIGKKDFYKHGTIEVAGEVINMSREMGGADIIVVDETGLGGGVVDLLRDELGKALPVSCEIRGVQFGAACEADEDREKYVNLKARMFGLLRDDIKSEQGLVLLNESIYTEELPTITFSYNRKGQMVIESKDEYKKRTGRTSPDSSDSLALANYGRYDSLTVGKFDKYTRSESTGTIAGGLNQKKGW